MGQQKLRKDWKDIRIEADRRGMLFVSDTKLN